MNATTPTCPNCGTAVHIIRVPTRVRRGNRVVSVPLETWECTGLCRSDDGTRPFAFTSQALALRNDVEVRTAWSHAFGEDLPAAKRPGRKPQEPRVRVVQVKLSESELRELDAQRGGLTRSEYIRAHALPTPRRTA